MLIMNTCHWCHVMEEESFEDKEVAAHLNTNYISVKVDKEERPDIDAVYMSVCQAITGSGGWPTTIFMTPEQKPFYGGTYFPKHRRYGHPGLLELLVAVTEKWNNDRVGLLEAGEQIATAVVSQRRDVSAIQDLDHKPVEQAAAQLAQSFDRRYGGFGSPPKFPMPHNLLFLLHCYRLGVEKAELELVEKTLTAMFQGGIFDHIGFGFSRYSTDEKWLAPHFEKMLYDNALMILALVSCFQVTGKPLYRAVAERTMQYIRREMTSPEGGFYSAQDADIGGEEGKYYTFTTTEIIQLLGRDEAERFCSRYDITESGNFEGKNIPNRIGREADLPDADMEASLEKLRHYRQSRFQLHKDDKILTSWNALMIAAYARAYRVLGDSRYLDSATSALAFIQQQLTDGEGRLFISYREGKAKGKGLLDDYAFLAWACLELYEATFEVEHLELCCSLVDTILTRFAGPDDGFYLSPHDGEHLLFRPKEQYDGAIPSGNSVAAWCLARLAALTGQARYREALNRQMSFYGPVFQRQPSAFTFALTALMQQVYPAKELVCVVGEESGKRWLALELGKRYLPQTAVLVKSEADAARLAKIAPFTEEYRHTPEKEFSFYLCQNQSCSAPFHDLAELLDRLIK